MTAPALSIVVAAVALSRSAASSIGVYWSCSKHTNRHEYRNQTIRNNAKEQRSIVISIQVGLVMLEFHCQSAYVVELITHNTKLE